MNITQSKMNTNYLALLLTRRLFQLYTDYFIRNSRESEWYRLYKSRSRGWDYVAIENANVTVSTKAQAQAKQLEVLWFP